MAQPDRAPFRTLATALLALWLVQAGPAEAAQNPPAYRVLIAKGKYRDAVRVLTKLARKGDPKAQFQLAVMQRSGLGTPRDDQSARKWLKQAAATGHKPAAQLLEKLSHVVTTDPLPAKPKPPTRMADVAVTDGTGPHASQELSFALARPFSDTMISGGASVVTKPLDESGITPLMLAARSGQLAVARTLIEQGADMGQASRDGRTALHWASEFGQFTMVEMLLEHGADPTLQDALHVRPADVAARRCDAPMFRLLTDKLPPAEVMEAAFAFSDRCKNPDWLQELNLPMDAQTKDKSGRSLLLAAVEADNGLLVDALLATAHALPPMRAGELTPLHVAAAKGNAGIVAALLLKGAAANVLDRDGNTPLMLAAAAGQAEATRLLLPVTSDVNLKNTDGKSALLLAVQGLHTDVVAALAKAGAAPTTRSLARDTPEKAVARFGNAKLTSALSAGN